MPLFFFFFSSNQVKLILKAAVLVRPEYYFKCKIFPIIAGDECSCVNVWRAFWKWTNKWAALSQTCGEGEWLTGEGKGGEKVTAGRRETKGGRQRGGDQTGKSCWPCISAWWHLTGPIWALNVKVMTLKTQGVGWPGGGLEPLSFCFMSWYDELSQQLAGR